MKKIADTGLLLAAADRHDRHHGWAAAALREHAPFFTCQAVVLETAWVLDSPAAVLGLIARGDLILAPAFDFAAEIPRLLELCRKYDDRPMALADACLVRMTELTVRCWETEPPYSLNREETRRVRNAHHDPGGSCPNRGADPPISGLWT